MVEYTPAKGANGCLMSFDGDLRLFGIGCKLKSYKFSNH